MNSGAGPTKVAGQHGQEQLARVCRTIGGSEAVAADMSEPAFDELAQAATTETFIGGASGPMLIVRETLDGIRQRQTVRHP